MLTVGDKFPAFELTGVDPLKTFKPYNQDSFAGKWKVYFFWPMDFTFVCPTEIAGFGALAEQFAKRNAQLLGGSIDTQYVHLAWRENNELLKDLPIPMLADVKRELTGALGILHQKAGVAYRATFIVDPENTIRFAYANDLSVGRNPEDVLRVLDALQTGELTPCAWKPGQPVLKP